MELHLKRLIKKQESTIGELTIDGKHECYICEDVDRHLAQDMPLAAIKSVKVAGQTAIPYGRYEIAITFSNRFQKPLPLLLDVKGFDGIRIHPGNTAADTDGCLLPGQTHTDTSVDISREAFANLFDKIKAAHEKIFITIE